MALIVCFEGIPASGKTTVIDILKNDLQTKGWSVEIVDIDNTGHTPVLHPIARNFPHGHPGRVMMYWVLRLQQYGTVVKLMKEVDIILADRFWYSTYIFDVLINNVPEEFWKWVGQYIKHCPDLTFFLSAPVSVTKSRKSVDMMQKPKDADKIYEAYHVLAKMYSWLPIDATQTPQKIKDDCLSIILSSLRTQH